MKKLFIISLFSIFLLTGCGATETMSCTYTANATNGNTQITYDVDYQKDVIKKVRVTYDHDIDNNNNIDNHTDGVGTGTDGTTSDTNMDDDGIVDGVIGSAIDVVVGGVTGIILDSAGLRDRHQNVQNTYGNITGFSVQNTNDVDNNYKVTYVIDYDQINDTDLANFNLSRDLDTLRTTYVNQGFTCK